MSDASNPNKDVTSNEPLATYERWEFTNFGSTAMSKTGKRQKADSDAIKLPTAAELEEIQRQAYDEGYQAGSAKGKQHIATLLNSMEQSLQRADQEIAQDLLNLAMEVARQMVQQVIKTNPEVLLNTISAAIASLPHFNQGAHLVLHPDDATMLRAAMGEQLSHSGWKIFEDAKITPGGARIETAHSQIDATLENRWQRIVAAIGQDSSWIQP